MNAHECLKCLKCAKMPKVFKSKIFVVLLE
jgi:hypothetical protein